MADYVHVLHRLNKRYDTHHVLRDITLAFLPGAKIGVIGHNGSGKSTLLRIIAGLDRAYDGVSRSADAVRVGYVPQEPGFDPQMTVRECLEEAVRPVRELLRRFEEIGDRLAEPLEPEAMERLLEEQARVQDRIDQRNAWEIDRELDQASHALGLPAPETRIATLSGGERRRVALCRVLLEQPELLLLDEPTNHLDAETVDWLEQHLKEYPGCVILVTHDRYVLDNVVGWMLELDRGRATPYEGNYSAYLEQRAERLRVEERQEAALQKVLARELEWIRTSPKARTAKNKARVRNYQQLVAREREMREGAIELHIPAGERLGDRVVSLRGVCKALGGRTLIRDLDLELPPGAVVGVIGKNGTGKTTLLRLIAGEIAPDSGTVTLGPTVQLCHVDQMRDCLDPARTVYEEITGGKDTILLGRREVNGRAYVARFNFKGPDQQKKVGECSGGMRNRIQLAKMLRRGGNVLLLDEPTNDLDVETLRILEEAIADFPGCAVVVSHDRFFLNRIATHILAFEGEGRVRFLEGDFGTYQEKLRAEREAAGLGAESRAGRHRRLR